MGSSPINRSEHFWSSVKKRGTVEVPGERLGVE